MKFIISIFFILTGFCSIAQNSVNEIIDDYIRDYRKAKFENKLVAISISSDKDSKYFISDISQSIMYGAANKLASEKQNFVLGVYQNIFCKITEELAKNNPDTFKPVDLAFFEKAKEASKFTNENGEILILDLDLQNYEPQLIIVYDYLLKVKKKIYIDGKIENIKM